MNAHCAHTHAIKDDLGSFDIENDLQAEKSRQQNVFPSHSFM